jgi:acetylornithine deacetylase/succinyl-diaminopimelate desuccinylase-like protein
VTADGDRDAVVRRLAAEAQTELAEFVAIPSVSALSAHRSDIERAARWLAARLERAGVGAVEVLDSGGHPVVTGSVGPAQAPAVLVYGHYDVQPADRADGWETDPFTPTVRDGRLYGRGASDDKGPILCALAGIEALLAGGPPDDLRLVFLFEGEEEIGSPHLAAFVARERERLAARLVLSADGGMWRTSEPSLNVSSKGLANVEVEVVTAPVDLHSGRHGGAVPNALAAMAELVAGLHDSAGRVNVPGFYDRVTTPTPEQRRELAAIPFDEEAYRREVGVARLQGEDGYSTLERLWLRPTLDVVGMWGGFTAEGMKTIVPARAHAKISCRLVPAQDPAEIQRLVIAHLEAQAPAGATVRARPIEGIARPYALPADYPPLRLAADVLEAVFGTPTLFVRMGGTLPAAELFRRELGAETMFFSFSVSDEHYHAPGEFFRLERVEPGARAWRDLLARLGPALAGPA